MGMRDYLNKIRKNAEDRLRGDEGLTPEQQKAKKKEEARKTFERMTTAINAAKKGLETYNTANKKVEGIRDDIAEKTIKITDAAKPIADKIDDTAGKIGNTFGDAFKSAKDALAHKVDEVKESNAKKPSTGSSILDILSPAVPETDATKPKKKKDGPKA